MFQSRQVLAGSARGPVAGARLIGRTDALAPIRVTVVLNRKNPLDAAHLRDHAALLPHQRPVLDHAQFTERYGAGDDGIAAVQTFAAAHSLKVELVDKARRVVELSGTATNMELAFGSELNDYTVNDRQFRGRRGPVLLSPDIHPFVEAVLGLDNRPVAKPRVVAQAAQTSYYPKDVAALYNFPPGDGAGQTIALIELGGNFLPADLQTYFQNAGVFHAPTVKPVSVSPNVPVAYGTELDSDGEVMLDIEVAGAMAPGATIVVYFAENSDQGFYQAASQAVHDPATTVVSISWGNPEKTFSAQSMDAWNTLGESAALLNVPIFVAAGDHGCADEIPGEPGYDGQRHVDFPGSCPSVVSCGGTNLVGSGASIASETVWSDNSNSGWATGGGVSTHFPLPKWQNGISADSTNLTMRGVPDVAAVADNVTGFKVIVNGKPNVSGGTSAVAPQWAALSAILSQALGRKAGFFLPLLYANAGSGVTNDIVSGGNSVNGVTGYSAKPGWDACTGLGSPNGAKILALLRGAPVPTNGVKRDGGGPQPAPSNGTPGGSAPILPVPSSATAMPKCRSRLTPPMPCSTEASWKRHTECISRRTDR